ncbi:hypothetical protein PG993_003735 [Apiospora rasikravindrae]|uniref:Uncharacterized protein n=1 Tax=Apiospora rasikravindrae TaxID=990691 RepID=A0ABR1U0C2_9PEZI
MAFPITISLQGAIDAITSCFGKREKKKDEGPAQLGIPLESFGVVGTTTTSATANADGRKTNLPPLVGMAAEETAAAAGTIAAKSEVVVLRTLPASGSRQLVRDCSGRCRRLRGGCHIGGTLARDVLRVLFCMASSFLFISVPSDTLTFGAYKTKWTSLLTTVLFTRPPEAEVITHMRVTLPIGRTLPPSRSPSPPPPTPTRGD